MHILVFLQKNVRKPESKVKYVVWCRFLFHVEIVKIPIDEYDIEDFSANICLFKVNNRNTRKR